MRYELEHITQALKEARERKGLSQRALSQLSGVPQGHISKIENGVVNLRVSSLLEIARALDMELSLVPRKSLSAVNAIIRSSEGDRQPAKYSREWAHILNKARSVMNEEPKRTDYAQIYHYLYDLYRISPSIDQNIKSWFGSNNIKELSNKLHDEKQTQNLLNYLRRLRNEFAHRLADKREAEEVKPAYSLEEDDDG